MDISIKEYGAVGDGLTLNTEIIQKAIDDCHASGGGRVTFDGGVYMTGRIYMKSNVELHIASSGVLLGSPECSDYPELEAPKHVNTDYLPRWRNGCIIFADECENIAITGNGKIDGNGTKFVFIDENKTKGWKYSRINAPTPPRAVFFTGCRNVKIEDVTLVNQPAGWAYWIHDCDYVTCDKLKIEACVDYPNNDGIHINCSRNVTVSNCSITCGDDCLVVRANSASLKENKPCERVTVTNCNLTSYSGGIRIGWVNDGVIRNCTFSNLVMTDTTIGVSIYLPHKVRDETKTDIYRADIGRESTLMENITFSNIIMDKTSHFPVFIRIEDSDYVHVDAVRKLYFSNIHANAAEFPYLQGRPDCYIDEIHFNDCTFEITDGKEFLNRTFHGACSIFDSEPCDMMLRYVSNFEFNNTKFTVRRGRDGGPNPTGRIG